MRRFIVCGLFIACATVVPSALACGPGGGRQVEIIITPPSPVAALQSQTFLADATRLDGKADVEENAAATSQAGARNDRRRAASIRVQAAQASETSQGALLAKADKLDAEAATKDVASATFLARARLIRARAKALRALSTRVLTSGALTAQALARVQLPAAPAGHPDKAPLKMLDAAPKSAPAPTVVVAGI